VSDDPFSHAWTPIRAELRRAVTESTWHLWLEPLRPAALNDGELVLEAPDEIRSWVTSNFSRLRAIALRPSSCTTVTRGSPNTPLA